MPPADVAAFMDEMNQAKATWRMQTYGGAVHALTNPAAGAEELRERGAAPEAPVPFPAPAPPAKAGAE